MDTIESHAKDYKPDAWKEYTFSELGHIVEYHVKKSTHRDNPAKKEKDLTDAANYLEMMNRKLAEIRSH